MTATRLDGIRACVFDAYGTLFDYASAAARCRDLLGDKLERLNGALAGEAAAIHLASRPPGGARARRLVPVVQRLGCLRRLGLRVGWCNRYGQRPERLPGQPDREVKSLAEYPDIVGRRSRSGGGGPSVPC